MNRNKKPKTLKRFISLVSTLKGRKLTKDEVKTVAYFLIPINESNR